MVTKFPEGLGRETRIVERGMLLQKGFSTVGTKLIHVPGTRNVTVPTTAGSTTSVSKKKIKMFNFTPVKIKVDKKLSSIC